MIVRKIKQLLFIIPSLVLAINLTGCGGGGKLLVLNPPTERVACKKTYRLVRMMSTVDVSEELLMQFEQELRTALTEEQLSKGDDLIMEYRFLEFEPGNRFVRCLSGGLSLVPYVPSFGDAGGGEMTVEVVFKNKQGKELSKIQARTKLTRGFIKGSLNDALEELSAQIVKYMLMVFKFS